MWDIIGREPTPTDLAHEKIFRALPGGTELEAFYGYVTQFHDAEVDDFRLELSQPSLIRLRYWRYKNGLVTDRHTVSLHIGKLHEARLSDIDPYSIIYALRFSSTGTSGTMIDIDASVGLGGSIRGEAISMKLKSA